MSGVLDPKTPVDIAARAQRARIIDAMIASCAAKTFPGTTISDVVSGASISRTTFYKHFADKRACFDAAVEAGIEEVRAVARGAHTPSDPPDEAVPKATAAILGLMAAKPELAQLLTGDAPAVEPAVVERYRALLIPAVTELWKDVGDPPQPHLDPNLAFARSQLLIFNQIAAGKAAELPELLPELAYLAVAPFAGHEQGLAQIRRAEAQSDPDNPPRR